MMGGSRMEKCRYIALTDINKGIEIDDIQSMLRLLLYANEIDIEGLIPCTSCFVKKPKPEKNLSLLLNLVDAYGQVLPNLRVHADGWPSAEELRSHCAFGIPAFGAGPGDGFADEKWNTNEGVQLILTALKKEDPRPLWVGLWGGANTLAQALWQAEQTETAESFDTMIRKLRIYAISDQDYAGRWMRERYGDRLFYIVDPSDGDMKGSGEFYKAAWPGISADRNSHGSEDGVNRTKGFSGADWSSIDKGWIRKNIRRVGRYGKLYPRTAFITEGDTPSYLGLIPNGLNEPEHPEYGGWGGRYEKLPFPGEQHEIWTSVSDTVIGTDGAVHTSPQATVWRWRTDFQNDFAARMQWTVTDKRSDAPHPVILSSPCTVFDAKPGEETELRITVEDPDGNGYDLSWTAYPEAGHFSAPAGADNIPLPLPASDDGKEKTFTYTMPEGAGDLHLILQIRTRSRIPVTRYLRFIIHT